MLESEKNASGHNQAVPDRNTNRQPPRFAIEGELLDRENPVRAAIHMRKKYRKLQGSVRLKGDAIEGVAGKGGQIRGIRSTKPGFSQTRRSRANLCVIPERVSMLLFWFQRI